MKVLIFTKIKTQIQPFSVDADHVSRMGQLHHGGHSSMFVPSVPNNSWDFGHTPAIMTMFMPLRWHITYILHMPSIRDRL